MEVQITPDHLTQNHKFLADIDQSYLAGFLAQCRAVLAEYPIRDPEQQLPIGSVSLSRAASIIKRQRVILLTTL